MTDPMHQIFQMLGEIRSDIGGIKEDITEIKQTTNDYKATKSKLIGYCIGVSAAVGGGLSAVLNKMGINL